MRILIIGFQPYENITYPHLKQVVQHFTAFGSDYALFRERGYFIDEAFKPGLSLKALLRSAYTFSTIAIDSIKLIARRLLTQYDLVIAVDNFAFITASTLYTNVILWSHDFVTDDQERSSAWIHKLIKSKLSEKLNRKANIIIQDQTRLSLFCSRYHPEGLYTSNVFFLPVSLRASDNYLESKLQQTPVLLQIGGINCWRSMSDKLLCHYQSHSGEYALAFHGFIDKEMQQKIRNAEHLPWTSSIDLDANCVNKIVSKCDIGFIAYNAGDFNFYYIGRASGQLVEFLRCGKPVIALGKTDLQRLVDEKKIGVAINHIDDLDAAIAKVLFNYPTYSSNCKKLYDEVYNLNNYLDHLTDWVIERAVL